MPDIAPTNITADGSNRQGATIRAGEALAALDVVYLNVDGRYYKADALTAEKAAASHIVVQPAAVDEFVLALPIAGNLNVTGVALGVGTQYVVSANGGKIAPKSDLTTGQFLTNLFVGQTTVQGRARLDATGIAVA